MYATESEVGVARTSRQDSVSSVPLATPSPVEKITPPIITRPDYAAGLGPLSSDTGSTLYGDHHHISSSQPPPTTPSTICVFHNWLLLISYLLRSSFFYSNISISSLSKVIFIFNSSSTTTTFTHYTHTISSYSCSC